MQDISFRPVPDAFPGAFPRRYPGIRPATGGARRLSGRAAVLSGAVLLVLSAPALAKEWFVSTAGNNSSGNGTKSKPYRTIQYALDRASAGDIVTVRGPKSNRTYNECDVRLRKKLTLRSYPGEQAHIHCNIKTPDSVTVQVDPAASGSRLRGLEISGGMYYGVMLQTNWYQGGSGKGASNVVMEDLLIHDTGRDGIKITPKSNNARISRVEIHHTGAIYPPGTSLDDKNADGIDNVNGSGMVVEDSYIHHTATTGVYFKGGAADVVIQRNRIEEAGQAGILVGFDTSVEFFDLKANPGYYEAVRGKVRNNFVKGTAYAGIGLYAAKDALVANNTIVNAARQGHAALYFGVTFQDWDPKAKRPPNVNPRLVNNLVVNGSRCMEIRHTSELGGLSGLSGSPGSNYNGFASSCRFTDRRPGKNLSSGTLSQWRSKNNVDARSISGSFSVDATGHLPAGSPAINKGTVLDQVPNDMDKQPRLSKYDIGADEYGKPASLTASDAKAAGSAPAPAPVVARADASDAGRTTPAAASAAPARSETEARDVSITPPLAEAWSRLSGWLERTGTQLREAL